MGLKTTKRGNEIGMSLDELLVCDDFRTRSPMYFGSWKLEDLFIFLNGIHYSIINYGIDEKSPLEGFREWLVNVKGYQQSGGKSWAMLILENNDMTSEQALDRFFKLYDEFKGR